jgi:hypothetical protein
MPTKLPASVKAQLRAISMCSEKTIERWWADQDSVRDATHQRLTAAAKIAALTLPARAATPSTRPDAA